MKCCNRIRFNNDANDDDADDDDDDDDKNMFMNFSLI